MIALLANEDDPWDRTLCEMPWSLVQVQVTVPPTTTVSTAGFVLPLWALMNTICPLFPTVTDPAGPPPPPPPPPAPPTAPTAPVETSPAAAARERGERHHADDSCP